MLGIGAASATMLVEDTGAQELRVLKRINVSGWEPSESQRIADVLLQIAQVSNSTMFGTRPSLITVHSVTVQNAFVNVLSEYFTEGDLGSLLNKTSTPLSATACLNYTNDIALGLREIHLMGISHCCVQLDRVYVREPQVSVCLGLPSVPKLYLQRAESHLGGSPPTSPLSSRITESIPPELLAAHRSGHVSDVPITMCIDLWHLGYIVKQLIHHRRTPGDVLAPKEDVLLDRLRSLSDALLSEDPTQRPAIEHVIERVQSIAQMTHSKLHNTSMQSPNSSSSNLNRSRGSAAPGASQSHPRDSSPVSQPRDVASTSRQTSQRRATSADRGSPSPNHHSRQASAALSHPKRTPSKERGKLYDQRGGMHTSPDSNPHPDAQPPRKLSHSNSAHSPSIQGSVARNQSSQRQPTVVKSASAEAAHAEEPAPSAPTSLDTSPIKSPIKSHDRTPPPANEHRGSRFGVNDEPSDWQKKLLQQFEELEDFQNNRMSASNQPRPKRTSALRTRSSIDGPTQSEEQQRPTLQPFRQQDSAPTGPTQYSDDDDEPDAPYHVRTYQPQPQQQYSAPKPRTAAVRSRTASDEPTTAAQHFAMQSHFDPAATFTPHTAMRTLGKHDKIRAIEENNMHRERKKEEFQRQRLEKEAKARLDREEAEERHRQHKAHMKQIRQSQNASVREHVKKFGKTPPTESEYVAAKGEGIEIYVKTPTRATGKPKFDAADAPQVVHVAVPRNTAPPRRTAAPHDNVQQSIMVDTTADITASTMSDESPSPQGYSPSKLSTNVTAESEESSDRPRSRSGNERVNVTASTMNSSADAARSQNEVRPAPRTNPTAAEKRALLNEVLKSPSIERPNAFIPVPQAQAQQQQGPRAAVNTSSSPIDVSGSPSANSSRGDSRNEEPAEGTSTSSSRPSSSRKTHNTTALATNYHQQANATLSAVAILEWQVDTLVSGLRKLMDPPVVEDVMKLVTLFASDTALSRSLPASNQDFSRRVLGVIGDCVAHECAMPLVFQLVALEGTQRLCEDLHRRSRGLSQPSSSRTPERTAR